MSQLPWKELREAAGDDGVNRVPDGWYDCVIKSTKVGQTANNYKKINARFAVINGPYAGTSIFKDFVVTADKPGGLKFFFRHMAVLGITAEQFTDDLTMEALADRILDRHAQVQVGTRLWNEQERMEVKDLKPLAGGGFTFGEPVPYATPTPVMPMPVPPVADPVMPVFPVTVQPSMDFDMNDLPPEPPF